MLVWKRAFQRVARLDYATPNIRSAFLEVWLSSGDHIRQEVGDDCLGSAYEIGRGPRIVCDPDGAACWVEAFKNLKEVMNQFFVKYRKTEREFQQIGCMGKQSISNCEHDGIFHHRH
jgi:hypothetical protein